MSAIADPAHILTAQALRDPAVAVLIPCFNEAVTIGKVVTDFRAALPGSTIYVYDNNSSDETAQEARAAGAVVRSETQQGKGHVVRRMFADVEADVYVLVDGDDTYDATAAPDMVRMLLERQFDMVIAVRMTEEQAAYRLGHRLGNAMFTGIVRQVFGKRISDTLSGYRAFSRRFVKSYPALTATGFEVEAGFSIHALELRLPIGELPTPYHARPEGSESKLRTYVDGLVILGEIVLLIRDERPLQFFGVVGLALLAAGFGFGIPVVLEFVATGLVPRLPTALLATSLVLLAFLSFGCGLVLDSVARGRKESKRLAYLAIPGVFTQR